MHKAPGEPDWRSEQAQFLSEIKFCYGRRWFQRMRHERVACREEKLRTPSVYFASPLLFPLSSLLLLVLWF
eukprot:c29132_g2_i1 orf=233-445(+)